jgi:hypothetical protein
MKSCPACGKEPSPIFCPHGRLWTRDCDDCDSDERSKRDAEARAAERERIAGLAEDAARVRILAGDFCGEIALLAFAAKLRAEGA